MSQFFTKERQLAPGKLVPSRNAAYSGCCCVEQTSSVYQVLTHPNQHSALKWAPASNGQTPMGAVQADGQPGKNYLHIARATFNSNVCCAKYEPGHRCAHLSLDGKEHFPFQIEKFSAF